MANRTILICGDRYWKDEKIIFLYVGTLPSDTRVITGGANGADKMAEKARVWHGLDGKVYNAKWHMFKKAAGPIRNRTMLKEENPYLVVAFHDNITTSTGTRSMLLMARKKGIQRQLRKSDGSVQREFKL